MTHIKSILTAAAFFAVAATGLQAQAVAPAPVKINFADKGIPVAGRVAAALAALESGTANPSTANAANVGQAAAFLLSEGKQPSAGALTVALKAASPQLIDVAIADPTFGGLVDNAEIRGLAIALKAPPKTQRAARVAHWQAALADAAKPLTPASRALIKEKLAIDALEQSLSLERRGDLAGAEAVLAAALPLVPDAVLLRLAEVRLARRGAGTLNTALQAWLVADFAAKPAATQAVANALQLEPGQGFDAATAFIEWVNTGAGSNPLAKAKIPAMAVDGGPGKEGFVRLVLAGDKAGALAEAELILATAKTQQARDAAGQLVLSALANQSLTLKGEAEARRLKWEAAKKAALGK